MKLYSLKLDAAWRPIEIITSFKAFSMCRSGRANPVEDYDILAHGNSMFPAVIVLKSYVRKHEFLLSCTRRNVYNRDNYTCQYCSIRAKTKFDLTLDHIVPKSRGGPKTWDNIVSSCHQCNEKKGARTPKEAGMRLLKEPKRPKATFIDFYAVKHIPKEWSPYIYLYKEKK
jgi:5-methylcytosine-specific restriction endonuclease McrA|tara:strand:+ start:589 stop:1101 length:513 start_codon:yes stop_codon:yes gene_type:complete